MAEADPRARLTAYLGPLDEAEMAHLLARWWVMRRWLLDLEAPAVFPPPPADPPGGCDFRLGAPPDDRTVTGLARAYRSGALSPCEVVRERLARIARLDPMLHSFVTLTRKRALADAAASAARFRAGAPLGPLDGVPYNLKDIIDVAGVVTSCQSRWRLGRRAARDADVAARLAAAGGVLLGKAATHEFAFGGPTGDGPFPLPRNPWDLARYAGGSSSGSAVSVAAGLVQATVGSDTGGSLRIPSAYCGTVSLKPSRGRISAAGVFPLAPSLDHVGPMAGSVEDCAQVFDALLGPGAAAATAAAGTATLLRVAVPRRWIEDQAIVAPAVRDAQARMEALLRSLGAAIVEVDLPHMAQCRAVVSLLTAHEAAVMHRKTLAADFHRYSDVFRRRVAPALLLEPEDIAHIDAVRRQIDAGITAALSCCDVMLLPATTGTAPVLAQVDALAEAARPSSFSQVTNLTGQPSLTLRAGFDAAGLPISLQLVGPLGADHRLLALGQRIESAMETRPYWPEYPIS